MFNVILITIPIFGTLFLLFMVVGILYTRCRHRTVSEKQKMPEEVKTENLFSIWSYDGKLVYEDIIEYTEEFDSQHCVGAGGHASVYKAELQTGQIVAVKKIHTVKIGSGVANLKAFETEIHALSESLKYCETLWFSHTSTPLILGLPVSRRGKLRKATTQWQRNKFAYTMEVNEKCDVYSFGVLTLEVIMEKHPGDLMISVLSSSLSTSSTVLDTQMRDILDQRLQLLEVKLQRNWCLL
ncbi:putative non-specific serine/threonine protein kinase [Rosa chinensis]|uniref:non-specific serine/threonine protein kinase n=1 Tax=Rosa chinensis TaxID=74649 RepID=A0A2P6S030_ROSCH|nr:putative non-specific serine/threonine protein kinase [Rosa chinensis]